MQAEIEITGEVLQLKNQENKDMDFRNSFKDRLPSILSQLGFEDIKSARIISEGMSSIVTVLTFQDDSTRVLKTGTHKGSDIFSEYEFFTRANSVGISVPQVDSILYLDEEDGIREFMLMENITLLYRNIEDMTDANFKLIAQTMAKLHNIEISKSDTELYPSHYLDIGEKGLLNRFNKIKNFKGQGLSYLFALAIHSDNVISQSNLRALCHGDLHSKNLFFDEDKELILFDPDPGIMNPVLDFGRFIQSIARHSRVREITELMIDEYVKYKELPRELFYHGIIKATFIKLAKIAEKGEDEKLRQNKELIDYCLEMI